MGWVGMADIPVDVQLRVINTLPALRKFIESPGMLAALQRLEQKNIEYGGSWQQLGSFINMADMLDKLKRAITYEQNGDTEILSIDEGFGNVVWDLLARALMTLMYRDALTQLVPLEIQGNVEELELNGGYWQPPETLS